MSEADTLNSAADWKREGDDLQRRGKFSEAIAAYQKAIVFDPLITKAMNNCGAAYGNMGNPEEAIVWFKRALGINPADADVLANIGPLLLKLERYEEMIESAQAALEIDPDCIQAMQNQSAAYGQMGDISGSLYWSDQILQRDGKNRQALINRATALRHLNREDEAVSVYQKLLQINPDDVEALESCAEIRVQQERFIEAFPWYDNLVKRFPGNSEYAKNYALILLRMEQGEPALEWAEKFLAADPRSIDGMALKSMILSWLCRFDEALALADEGLKIFPGVLNLSLAKILALIGLGQTKAALALINESLESGGGSFRGDFYFSLSKLYLDTNEYELSLEASAKAIELKPLSPRARRNRAEALWFLDRYSEAWDEHEWRLSDPVNSPLRLYTQPVWDGRSPEETGGKILITSEGGFGDIIQFARYALVLAERGHEVLLEMPPELYTLFRSAISDHRITIIPKIDSLTQIHRDLPFASYIPIMSLPYRLGTTRQTIPNYPHYLTAPKARVDYWHQHIDHKSGKLNVGLVWAGNPKYQNDHHRSIPAETMAALCEGSSLNFYSIRKGEWDLSAFSQGAVTDLGPRIQDFIDTAAIIENLDLVITVDTSVAHLTGALGKPVWTLIAHKPDWRWHMDTEKTQWYPTMRLFRQKEWGDWTGVVAEVATTLNQFSKAV